MNYSKLFLDVECCDIFIHQVSLTPNDHLLRFLWRSVFQGKMYLQYVLYIVMISFGSYNLVYADRTYSLNDRLTSCSRWLSTIIYNFCSNTYKIVKRDTSLMIEKLAPKELKKETVELQLVSGSKWNRVRRQVANECCLRSCSVGDLLMYCPNDSKIIIENPDIFE